MIRIKKLRKNQILGLQEYRKKMYTVWVKYSEKVVNKVANSDSYGSDGRSCVLYILGNDPALFLPLCFPVF